MQKKRILALLLVVFTLCTMAMPFSVLATDGEAGSDAAGSTTTEFETPKPEYDREELLGKVDAAAYPADTYPWAVFTKDDEGNFVFYGAYKYLINEGDAEAPNAYDTVDGDDNLQEQTVYFILRKSYNENAGTGSGGANANRNFVLDLGEYVYNPHGGTKVMFGQPNKWKQSYTVYGGIIKGMRNIFTGVSGEPTDYSATFNGTTFTLNSASNVVFGGTVATTKLTFNNCVIDISRRTAETSLEGITTISTLFKNVDLTVGGTLYVVESADKTTHPYTLAEGTTVPENVKVVVGQTNEGNGDTTFVYNEKCSVTYNSTTDKLGTVGDIAYTYNPETESPEKCPFVSFTINADGTYAFYRFEKAWTVQSGDVTVDGTVHKNYKQNSASINLYHGCYVALRTDYTITADNCKAPETLTLENCMSYNERYGNFNWDSNLKTTGVLDLNGFTLKNDGAMSELFYLKSGTTKHSQNDLAFTVKNGTLASVNSCIIYFDNGASATTRNIAIDFEDVVFDIDGAVRIFNQKSQVTSASSYSISANPGFDLNFKDSKVVYTLQGETTSNELFTTNKLSALMPLSITFNGFTAEADADIEWEDCRFFDNGVQTTIDPTYLSVKDVSDNKINMRLDLTNQISTDLLIKDNGYSRVWVTYEGTKYSGTKNADGNFVIELPKLAPQNYATSMDFTIKFSYAGFHISDIQNTFDSYRGGYATKDITIDVNAYLGKLAGTPAADLATAVKNYIDAAVDYNGGVTSDATGNFTNEKRVEALEGATAEILEITADINGNFTVNVDSEYEALVLRVSNGSGKYIAIDGVSEFTFNNYSAADMAKTFTFALFTAEGVQVSDTITYSFETFCAESTGANGATINLFNAMLAYADAAAAYNA